MEGFLQNSREIARCPQGYPAQNFLLGLMSRSWMAGKLQLKDNPEGQRHTNYYY